MSFNYKSLLPTPAQIKAEFPLTPECVELKAARDKEIADVITGKSKKFLVIIGPCSADREDAVCEYMSRLAKVNEQVKDKLVIVPRVYTNKPRTTGGGYKGMLHQPDPEKKPNMYEGLVAIRKLHMRVIKDYGFTTADEMLYPENYSYLSDVLSYGAFCGDPAAPPCIQRYGRSGWNEEPDQRRPRCYVKCRLRCTAWS